MTHSGQRSRRVVGGGDEVLVATKWWPRERGGLDVPEWIGTVLFFLAVGLTAAKLNEDFGENGLLGYALLVVMIAVFAAAVGFAYV